MEERGIVLIFAEFSFVYGDNFWYKRWYFIDGVCI